MINSNQYSPAVDLLDDSVRIQVQNSVDHNNQSRVAFSNSLNPTTASSDYYSANVYPLVAQCIEEEQKIPQNRNTAIQSDYPLANAVPYHLQESYRHTPAENTLSTIESYNSVPSHVNPDGSTNKNNLPPKVLRFKQKRKIRTAASTGAGVIVGGIVLGPVGAVMGGVGGYVISKKVGKHREKKLLEKCLNEQAGGAGSNWKSVDNAVSA